LNHWVTGWIDWNLFLNTEGLPKWNDNKGFSSPVYIDTKAKEAYKQSTFYVLGHFSKFIPPDSHRIGHKLEKNIDKLYVLTIKRPDNATVLIAANMNNEEIDLKITDSGNHLSHTLSPHSIQSYIWW
jgi:glucosylceramidase